MLKTTKVLRLRRRREKRERSLPSVRLMHWGLTLLAGMGMLAAIAALAAALGYAYLTARLPSVAALPPLLDAPNGLLLHPSHYYFADGEHLLGKTPPISAVSLTELPRYVPDAVLTAVQPETPADQPYRGKFWQTGFPPTIAEQLALRLLLRDERPSRRRRLRARLLAAQMLADYGANRVLEWYLNTADFGNGIVGIDDAARSYLGKPAQKLSLSESALLAAVLPSPQINPWDAPSLADQRRQALIMRMLAAAKITAPQAQAALTERPKPTKRPAPPPAALLLAQKQLAALGWYFPRRGLDVLTTLDFQTQSQAECLRSAVLKADLSPTHCPAARFLPPSLLANPLPPNAQLEAAVLDVKTSAVLALVSPNDLPPHEAGTFLAPWVYAVAFTRGFSPATLTWDVPSALPEGIDAANPDGRFHGPMRLRLALANDYLVPTLHLLAQLGADTVWPTAAHLGLPQLTSRPHGYDALLGGVPLNILQAAHAFSIFAALGDWRGLGAGGSLQPEVVRRAVDADQNLRLAPRPVERRVLGEGVSYLVVNVLADTGAKWQSLGHPNQLEIGKPVASHIGRAPDGGIWVAGATPNRLVVVYARGGKPAQSEQAALAYWHALARTAFTSAENGWSKPANVSVVTVCDPSGMLPTADCPNWVEEVFLSGNEPKSPDTLFRRVPIDKETGLLATAFTPPELIEERVYMHVPPEARAWAKQAGLPLPPDEYDLIVPPPKAAGVQITAPRGFAYVRGKVAVVGTAAGANFAHYILQAGAGVNPHEWTTIAQGNSPVANGKLGEWDTAGLSGLYTLQLLVAARDGSLRSQSLQVTVDNEPPRVAFGSPRAGEKVKFRRGGYLIVRAEVEDDLRLASVSLSVDGKPFGTLVAPPYIFAVPMHRGQIRLRLTATDAAGNRADAEMLVPVESAN